MGQGLRVGETGYEGKGVGLGRGMFGGRSSCQILSPLPNLISQRGHRQICSSYLESPSKSPRTMEA